MTEAHQIQFNNHLIEYIKEMRSLFPENKRLFSKYYKYYRGFVEQGKRIEFIGEFIQYISKYMIEISGKDEGLFSEDEGYYPSKPIQLMKGIDFKSIWSVDLSIEVKDSIWKYLQTLYLIGTHVLKETDKYKELLKKQEDIMLDLIQHIKYEKKIKEDAEKMNDSEKEEKGGFDMSGLGDIFDENNIIIQIAKEIAKEIIPFGDTDAEGMNDPMKMINMLLNNDSTKLQDIIMKVSSKLTNIMKDKGLNEQQLLEQAKIMSEKIMGTFKNIPGMPNLDQLSKNLADNLASTSNTQQDISGVKISEESIKELTNKLKDNMAQLGVNGIDNIMKSIENICLK